MRFAVICFLSLLSAALHADTFVWKVSKDNRHLYLGGTFHMLMPSDYPLPAEFDYAYEQVNWLVFETDIAKLGSTEFQQKFQQAFVQPNGQTLQDQLSADEWQRLQRYCQQRQIPLAQYQSMTVQFISLVIMMHELKRYGMTAEGVDNHFYLRAKADGKVTSQLESVDDQIRYLATMAQGNEDNLIRQTIDDAQQLEQMMTQMRQSWRSGDLTTLTATGITPMQRDYPRIYQSLLVERNNNWMPRIKKLLQHPEPKLILVGALHLAGPDGLLAILAGNGYQLEQLSIQPAAVP
jgi:uncharacterized protein YbaP (TraB family)